MTGLTDLFRKKASRANTAALQAAIAAEEQAAAAQEAALVEASTVHQQELRRGLLTTVAVAGLALLAALAIGSTVGRALR